MSLQDYEILGKLGAGSFGVVHKARDRKTNSIVVLKIVDISKMNSKLRKNAMDEGKILKEMNSPYIVKHFNTFIVKSSLHIVMEYCPKGDLGAYLKAQMGKPLKEEKIWKFSIQMMAGLRDLHMKKILHRDMKSLNVFLDADHNVRIGDLGVAKTLKTDFAYTIVGTPYYLSPQMCEQKPYNQKTDIWAMGCIIYELCSGKHPFEANNQAALALKIVMGKYEQIPSNYSPDLSWIVRSCLSVDYKRRPSASYLLTMPKIVEWARKLNISINHQENNKQEQKKKQAQKLTPPAPPSTIKKQQSKKSNSENQNSSKTPNSVVKQQKQSDKINKVIPASNRNVQPRKTSQDKNFKNIEQRQQLQKKVKQKSPIKSKQKDVKNKSKQQFFNIMKAENQGKKLSAAKKMQMKQKQKVGIQKHQLPPKPQQKPQIKKYESQKPKNISKTDKIKLLFGEKGSSAHKDKMNITMNRFIPENVRQKNLIDIEDQKRLDKVEIPDSDSSQEDKKEKKNNKGMNQVVQMAQKQVDDDLLEQFGLPPKKKKQNEKKTPGMQQFQLDKKTKTIDWDLVDSEAPKIQKKFQEPSSDEQQTATMNDIRNNLQATPSSDSESSPKRSGTWKQGSKYSSKYTQKTELHEVGKNESLAISSISNIEKICKEKKGIMKQLPTIKANSASDLCEVKIEQYNEDNDDVMEEGEMIMQQIEQNRPYISDEEEQVEDQKKSNERNGQTQPDQLLIEDFDQRQQDLNKKRIQNQKRKCELQRMKNHNEKEILKMLPKQQYQKLKQKLVQFGEDEVQEFVASWKNNIKAINLFYRIIHFQNQIQRCHANINTIDHKVAQIKKNKM